MRSRQDRKITDQSAQKRSDKTGPEATNAGRNEYGRHKEEKRRLLLQEWRKQITSRETDRDCCESDPIDRYFRISILHDTETHKLGRHLAVSFYSSIAQPPAPMTSYWNIREKPRWICYLMWLPHSASWAAWPIDPSECIG